MFLCYWFKSEEIEFSRRAKGGKDYNYLIVWCGVVVEISTKVERIIDRILILQLLTELEHCGDPATLGERCTVTSAMANVSIVNIENNEQRRYEDNAREMKEMGL